MAKRVRDKNRREDAVDRNFTSVDCTVIDVEKIIEEE